jgi:hypothetical protein
MQEQEQATEDPTRGEIAPESAPEKATRRRIDVRGITAALLAAGTLTPSKPTPRHETDEHGHIKKLLAATQDPGCHCPRACKKHGTVWTRHEKPGSRAAQRRLRQMQRAQKPAEPPVDLLPCEECGAERDALTMYLIENRVLCEECHDKPSTEDERFHELFADASRPEVIPPASPADLPSAPSAPLDPSEETTPRPLTPGPDRDGAIDGGGDCGTRREC